MPPWKSVDKQVEPDEYGMSGAVYYGHNNGEALVIKNTPNYLEVRMRSDELPVSFQMFDWHYPNMAINPDVMQEHVIESYCSGTANAAAESRRICGAFGADATRPSASYSWKF